MIQSLDRFVVRLDKNITDSKIQKSLPNICRIMLALFLVFSFPLNFYSEPKTDLIQEAYADGLPVKVDQDRNSETWILPSGKLVSKIGGESKINFFDNSTNTWVTDKVIALSVNSFKVQSGLISTIFENDIIHYDMNMTNQVSREKPVLLNKVDKNYIEVPLVFVERTLNIITEPSFESVSDYIVNDEITVMNVLEKYSTSFGDFFIKYTYKDGKPLKHTFTLPSSPLNDGQTFAFAHDFELLNYNNDVLKSDVIEVKDALTKEEIVSDTEKIEKQIEDGKVADTIDSQKIRIVETETNELVKELSSDEILTLDKTTLEKTDAGDDFTKVTIVDSNNNFLLGEIIAETKDALSWEKFKEVKMDNTQTNPHVRFIYGDWIGGFELDPDTYSSNNPIVDGTVLSTASVASTCTTTGSSLVTGSTVIAMYVPISTNNDQCFRAYAEFDISSIPAGSTVSDSVVKYDVQLIYAGGAENCDQVAMTARPSTATADEVWDSITSDTVMVDNDATCTTVADNKSEDLGALGDTYFTNQIASGWGSIGWKQDLESRGAGNEGLEMASEEGVATPKPTLELTYTTSINTTFNVDYNNGTALTSGSVIQSNATTSRTISINSTGFAGAFTGLSGNQNVTTKESVDNFVVNKTRNFTPLTNIVITTNIYNVDCTQTGSGNDIELKINNTDGHTITAHTTPTCDSNNNIVFNATYSADGANSANFTSSLIASVRNGSAYGKDPRAFTINSTDIADSFSSDKITASFDVATGLITKFLMFNFTLDGFPDIPTSGDAVGVSTSQIDLTWIAGNNGTSPLTGFKIFNSSDNVTFSTLVNSTNSTSVSYSRTGLSEGQTEYYKVAGWNYFGLGDNSTSFSGITQSTVVGGGGGSSGGGGSVLPTSVSNALLLNLGSKTISHSLGEKRTYSLELLWDKTKEFSLNINSIKIGNGNFDSLSIIPELLPLTGKKIIEGKGEIFLTVDAPGDKCNEIQMTARCVYVKTYTIPVTVSVTGILGTSYPDIPAVLTISIVEKFPIGLAIVVILLLAVSYPIAKIISQNTKKQSRKSPKQMQKDHQKALKKSEKMERKQAKHDMNLFKKIKKEF